MIFIFTWIKKMNAVNVDRTRDLQIFSLTLSQLSYPRKLQLHQPGIEPGSVPWQGTILPLDHWYLMFWKYHFTYVVSK